MRKLSILFAGCLLSFTVAAATTDTDSFGRPVRYLDVAISASYFYGSGVTGTVCPSGFPATIRCTAIPNVAVMQPINETDIARIDLPAGATHSLLCFSTTSNLLPRFANTTTANVNGFLSFVTNVTIESAVLSNPVLINKVTGLPFDGKISGGGITNYFESKTLLPGTSEQKGLSASKECINGFSRRVLQSAYGLTSAQARAVFAGPITLRFSSVVQMQNVTGISWSTGIRMYGD